MAQTSKKAFLDLGTRTYFRLKTGKREMSCFVEDAMEVFSRTLEYSTKHPNSQHTSTLDHDNYLAQGDPSTKNRRQLAHQYLAHNI